MYVDTNGNPLMTLSMLGAPHSPIGIRENSKEPMPGPGENVVFSLSLGSTGSCQ